MSEVAELISEAIDATSNHVDLIDRIIAENGEVTCTYCGKVSFKGLTVENGQWASVAKQAMTEHALSCDQRPEAKLISVLVDARKYTQMAIVSLRTHDLRAVEATLADLLKTLTPESANETAQEMGTTTAGLERRGLQHE